MLVDFLLLSLSLGIMMFGAELALNSSERVGYSMGLSPLVVGMILVGFGTSLPEFFVSHIAVWNQEPEMALGNVVGSNIANGFLILGLSTLIMELDLRGPAVSFQLLIHFFITLILAYILISQAEMNFFIAALLLSSFGFFLFRSSHSKETADEGKIPPGKKAPLTPRDLFKLMGGFAMLYVGGELLIKSGKNIGLALGVSEYIISVILVAFGTSVPELATSLVACWRKKDAHLITGNIIGSNIFNISFVLGSTALYRYPLRQSYLWEGGALMVLAISFLLFNQFKIPLNRWVGVFYLGCYGGMVAHWLWP